MTGEPVSELAVASLQYGPPPPERPLPQQRTAPPADSPQKKFCSPMFRSENFAPDGTLKIEPWFEHKSAPSSRSNAHAPCSEPTTSSARSVASRKRPGPFGKASLNVPSS